MSKTIKNPGTDALVISGEVIAYKYYGKYIQGVVVSTNHTGKVAYITLKNVKTNLKNKEIMSNIMVKRLLDKDENNTCLWEIEIK